MSDGLPKLPGFTFDDPVKTSFSISPKFDYINGYSIPRTSEYGIGKTELDANSVGFLQNPECLRYDPSLTYGRTRAVALPQFLPHFVYYANKCLTFNAFFKQSVNESPDEFFRVRFVNIIYFLDDDTITVMEPATDNAGFVQGKYLKRSKIPKNEAGDFWNWKDLNVGVDLGFYGTVFHTYDCDTFTKEYMLSQGIPMNPREDKPHDPYYQLRKMANTIKTRITAEPDDKMRRFLEYDGKILKFDCIYKEFEDDSSGGREHVVYYYLADDTIAVKEVRKRNDGRDPFPLVLKRMKLPKDWKNTPVNHPGCFQELTDVDYREFYQPKDLLIGETIFVLGRRFLIYDCDKFTRHYFKMALNIEQKPAITPFPVKQLPIQKQIPPHVSGLGSLEDSLGFCFSVRPNAPKVDQMKLLLHANKYLRYLAEMVSTHPEDSIRKFLILYALSDGTIKVYEPSIRNSGIWGGKYLSKELIRKPNTDPECPEYYTPVDFYIGAIISIHKHLFRIIGADLYVFRYIMENRNKFTPTIVDNMRNYMFNQGLLKDDLRTEYEDIMEQWKKDDLETENRSEKELPVNKALECYDVLKGPTHPELIPPRPGTFDDDIAKVVRLESTQIPPPQEYGVSIPMKDCRYSYGDLGTISSGACTDVRPEQQIPCCLIDTCPVKSEYGTEKEKSDAYYRHLRKEYQQVEEEAKLYHALPCSKADEDGQNGTSQKQRKVVTFADNPNDPCAFNEDDLCKRKIKTEHRDCTNYDRT